jgi:hypothetical protein
VLSQSNVKWSKDSAIHALYERDVDEVKDESDQEIRDAYRRNAGIFGVALAVCGCIGYLAGVFDDL